MVQEVQTWVGITNETTLETIQAVGTSSVKIVEGRQTTWGHHVSRCIASWNIHWNRNTGDNRDSGILYSEDMRIDEDFGTSGFSMRDGGVRVPTEWSYQIDIERGGGASQFDATFILKWGGRILYSKSSGQQYYSENITIIVNLGKFDIIEICWDFYYSGSSTSFGGFFGSRPTLTITQL